METVCIDLRSDTVTRPSQPMREAMATAEVGDDVYGEDPTVNRLQQRVAQLLAKEAALFVPSGTMGNQTCIKVHTQPGDELIAERDAHIFNYETAGAAFLSSVQVHPVEGDRGMLSLDAIKRAVRPSLYYMPRTSLLCVENTHNRAGGTITPIPLIKEIHEFARNANLKLHLDGARIWNASVATGVPSQEYASYFDSVSVCLSKGLGAPVGSVIAGTAEFIEEARHYRKIFGGGMRQAGILAAAGLYALEHNVERLKEDHENAHLLAEMLSAIQGFAIDPDSVETNIAIVSVSGTGKSAEDVIARAGDRGILLSMGSHDRIRAVTHMDVTREEVRKAGTTIQELFG
ncbi:MAG: low-specificity L-threonine aldolase [Bacteroidota bacterium]